MKRLTKLAVLVLLTAAPGAAARAQSVQSVENEGRHVPLSKEFQKARLLHTYDPAEGETVATMMPMWLEGGGGGGGGDVINFALALGAQTPMEGVRFTVSFKYPGNVYVAPRGLTLQLSSTKRGGRRFADGDALALLADGQSLGLTGAAYTSNSYKADAPKRGTEYADELLTASLSLEDLDRVVAAKMVEVKVGARSWKVSGEQLKALRHLAAGIKEMPRE